MTEKLFVYGTLGLGRPNEHILSDIGGSWEIATVKGILHEEGWGAEMGYPDIEINESGEDVEGFVFTSENLSSHWDDLEAFEGEGYVRMLLKVTVNNGSKVDAYIYTLLTSGTPKK